MEVVIGFMPFFGTWLYLVPLIFCVYGYTIKTVSDYRRELRRREEDGKHYWPQLTVGVILGRALVSILPVVNLGAAIFDIGPKVFADVFTWLGKVFDRPLVPRLPPEV